MIDYKGAFRFVPNPTGLIDVSMNYDPEHRDAFHYVAWPYILDDDRPSCLLRMSKLKMHCCYWPGILLNALMLRDRKAKASSYLDEFAQGIAAYMDRKSEHGHTLVLEALDLWNFLIAEGHTDESSEKMLSSIIEQLRPHLKFKTIVRDIFCPVSWDDDYHGSPSREVLAAVLACDPPLCANVFKGIRAQRFDGAIKHYPTEFMESCMTTPQRWERRLEVDIGL